MFGFGGSKATDQQKNALIDATAGEEGISALGGLSTSNLTKTKQSEQSLTEQQKEVYSHLLGNEEDYLIMPGASRDRPRSAVFTHTIGMAVTAGGSIGAVTGAVSNWNMQLFKSPIERSKFITMIVRRIRNNAIRFGGFATIFSSAGVLLEISLRPAEPEMPSQEEIYDMELKGTPFQEPVREPLDEKTQQHITTAGIVTAAVGITAPKTIELWKKANKIQNLAQAQSDAGVMEAFVMKQWGKKAEMAPEQLAKNLKRLAVTKMVGVLGVAFLVDYMWRKQMHDKINNTVRKFSSSVY